MANRDYHPGYAPGSRAMGICSGGVKPMAACYVRRNSRLSQHLENRGGQHYRPEKLSSNSFCSYHIYRTG